MLGEGLRIAGDDDEPAGGDLGFLGEGVGEFLDRPSGEIDGGVAGVMEFQPLELVKILGGVVEDLVDDDGVARWGRYREQQRQQDGERSGWHERISRESRRSRGRLINAEAGVRLHEREKPDSVQPSGVRESKIVRGRLATTEF